MILGGETVVVGEMLQGKQESIFGQRKHPIAKGRACKEVYYPFHKKR
jgi:hypothetical protein